MPSWDHNKVQLDGTDEEIMPLGDIAAKFSAFGWHTIQVDGHNIADMRSNRRCKKLDKRPVLIIAETIKGKGVSFMEGKNIWHGQAISDEYYEKAMQELEGKTE